MATSPDADAYRVKKKKKKKDKAIESRDDFVLCFVSNYKQTLSMLHVRRKPCVTTVGSVSPRMDGPCLSLSAALGAFVQLQKQ